MVMTPPDDLVNRVASTPVSWDVPSVDDRRQMMFDILDAIPDNWAKLDGEWVRITSDGVGYGEFDRAED